MYFHLTFISDSPDHQDLLSGESTNFNCGENSIDDVIDIHTYGHVDVDGFQADESV